MERDGDDLTVRALIDWDGTPIELPRKGLLGRRAHGAWFVHHDALVLGPFAGPLSPAVQGLFQHGTVRVPGADIDEFAVGYLPRVRRTVDVAVGEGIEKKQENFAEEIASMIKG